MSYQILNFILQYRLDYIAFVLLSIVILAFVRYRVKKHFGQSGVRPVFIFLLVMLLLGVGALSEVVGYFEKQELKELIKGMAPTYAQELSLMNHAYLENTAPPYDPLYLSLIEAEIRWLKANPAISDIYTLRKKAGGRVIFVVDSETDYDRNGRYEGSRESRTPLGEPFPPGAVNEYVEQAFLGKPSFDSSPYTDRWGTWVTAYEPMVNAAGRVEAVLGVDYSARLWLKQILNERISALGISSLFLILIIGSMIANRAVRQIVLQYQSLINNVPGAVYRGVLNKHLVMVILSSGIKEISGYPADEFIENRKRSFDSIIHPDDCEWMHQNFRDAVSRGKPYEGQYRIIRADHQTVWVYERGQGVYDAQGKLLWVDGTIMDITNLKSAQAAQEQSEEKFRLLADEAPVGIFTTDARGECLYTNKKWQEMSGFNFGEALGQGWKKALHPEDRERIFQVWKDCCRQQKTFSMQYRIQDKSGRSRWVYGQSTGIFNVQGELNGFIGTMTDIPSP